MIRASMRPYGAVHANWVPLEMEEPGDITTLVEEFVAVVRAATLGAGTFADLVEVADNLAQWEATTFPVEVQWESGRSEVISVSFTTEELLVTHAHTLVKIYFAAQGLRKDGSS